MILSNGICSIAYIAILNESACVVPSFDYWFRTLLSRTTLPEACNCCWHIVRGLEKSTLMLCNSTCRLLLLKAFTASTKRVASFWFSHYSQTFPALNESRLRFLLHPEHIWTSFAIDMATLALILRKTSPTPIGLNPGLLSSGTSRHAKNASSESQLISLMQIFLMKSAIAFLRSLPLSPFTLDALAVSSIYLRSDQKGLNIPSFFKLPSKQVSCQLLRKVLCRPVVLDPSVKSKSNLIPARKYW